MSQLATFASHHLYLVGALVLIIIAMAVVELLRQYTGPKHVTPTQATLMINHQNAQLIDMRQPEQFQKGHILGAQQVAQEQIQPSHQLLQHLTNENGTPRPVIIICEQGIQAKTVANCLLQLGMDNVYVLQGGMSAWRDEGMPVVK